MNKVTVTQEQAKAIEVLHGVWSDSEKTRYYPILIKEKLRGRWGVEGSDAALDLSDDDFIKALYFGYEIENTPEDEIREYYQESLQKYRESGGETYNEGYYDGVTDGIVKTLRKLGKSIEGVSN